MTGLRKLHKLSQRVAQNAKLEMVDVIQPKLANFPGKWQNELLSGAPSVIVPKQAWLKYFPLESNELFAEQCFGNRSVSIHDLSQLANGGSTNRVLFVAAMMWGRGPKNGRLMPKFEKVSIHPNFEETLRKTRELIIEDKPVDAYKAWIKSGVEGIGEAFFTKWFFVCGLDSRVKGTKPLVLDKRVWNSLSAIGWSSERQTGAKYRTDPAGAYGAYLHAAHVWASELSTSSVKISPLQVEQFLFRKNGKNLL
jgi:hypothetical protein